ncbi:MAG TPA: YdcF family protein [Pyrinomonadaceae bacterium]|nr:YdcF family protein [Pyrinomonadaceae bacterium]
MKKATRLLKIALVLVILTSGFIATRIYTFGKNETENKADAAIVLGAAVWGQQVSPVFRERINHALDLYRQGKVRKIIFTGGQGNSNEPTEASAARAYAIQNGVNGGDVLIEQRSHTTFENLVYAKQVADANALQKVLIVSDPLHMKRAILMAQDIGLDAYPSPTPTTRYQGWRSQTTELGRETYYYAGYLVSRLFK